MKPPRLLAVLLLAACAAESASAAVSTLVLRSSATLVTAGSGQANATAVDATDNVVVAGAVGSDAVIAKYSRNLALISSATFNDGGPSAANAVAVSAAGKIAVAVAASSKFVIVLYDSNLVFQSSTSFTLGLLDTPQGIAFDSAGDVYVTGSTFDGSNFRYLTVMFSPALALLHSRATSTGSQDLANAVALDSGGNVFVTGVSDSNILTLRYDPALAGVTATASFAPAAFNKGRAVVVKGTRVLVAGEISPDDVVYSQVVASYSTALVFAASGTYSSGDDDRVNAASADGSGNLYVAGQTSPGGAPRALLIKYTSALVAASTAAFTASSDEVGRGVAVDSKGNPVVGGETQSGGPTNLLVLRYNGPPTVTAASQGIQGSAGQTVTLTGDNYAVGTTASFSNLGIVVNGAGPNGSSSLLVNMDIGASVPLGNYGVTVTNSDGSAASANGLFQVIQQIGVTAAAVFSGSAVGTGGPISLSGPANTFSQDVVLTLDQPSFLPPPGGFLASGVSVEVQPDLPGTLIGGYTAVLSYANVALTGLTPSKLKIAVYDTLSSHWIALPSTVDTIGKTVTATVNKTGILQIMQGGGSGGGGGGGGGGSGIPASDRHEVFAGPNPYKPGGGNFSDPDQGRGILFYNLTPTFRLEIYNANGTRVFNHSGASSGGLYLWDTGTSGGPAGTGVYVFRAYDGGGRVLNKGKLAIIR